METPDRSYVGPVSLRLSHNNKYWKLCMTKSLIVSLPSETFMPWHLGFSVIYLPTLNSCYSVYSSYTVVNLAESNISFLRVFTYYLCGPHSAFLALSKSSVMSCLRGWFQEPCLWLRPAEVSSLGQLYDPGSVGGLAGQESRVLLWERSSHHGIPVIEWQGSIWGAGESRLLGWEEIHWWGRKPLRGVFASRGGWNI